MSSKEYATTTRLTTAKAELGRSCVVNGQLHHHTKDFNIQARGQKKSRKNQGEMVGDVISNPRLTDS